MPRFRNAFADPIIPSNGFPTIIMKLICPIRHCVLALTTATAIATPILDMDFATWADTNSDGNLDDGERMQDVSGNGHHGFWGSTNGNIPFVSTSDGPAIDTSGAGYGKILLRDALTGIPDAWDGPTTTITPYFSFNGSQSYTFEAVVNWNGSTQAVNGLMGQTSGNELWIRESGGFLHYAFVSGAANANLFSNTIDISAAKADGQWHVISVVYDATAKQIRSYLDGTLKHTNSDPDIGSLGTMINGANDISIGSYNATSSNFFDGRQKRYRISNGALAPAGFLTAPAPVTGAPITWTGGTDANWDTTTAGNWKLDADNSPVLFTDNSPSTFDGSGAAGSITLVGTVAPAALSVSSDSPASYTFSGGTLGGTGPLEKSGTSTLTLAGPVTRAGTTNLNGGTLVIGDGATLGDAPTGIISIASGSTLKISRADTVDYSTSFRIKEAGGAGAVVIDGGGTLIVNPGTGTGFDEATSWSSLLGGVTVIGNSELRTLRNGRTAMGSGTVTLGDATTNGALAQYNGSWTWTNPIALVGPANAIRNRSSNAFARILKLQGVISGSGGLIFEDPNGTMTDNQTGYILTGENTTNGTITIATGVPVRVGGLPGDTDVTQNGPGTSGSLGTAAIINQGFLTYSRTDAHTVANTITGSGALFVGLTAGTASQVVNLTGTATHTGNTTVRSGTLLLNGTHGSTVPEIISQLVVSAGATLGGVGNTSSDVQLNGRLAPGITTGTFATTNWLNLHGGSTYTWDLTLWSGGTPGTDSDLATADEIHIEPSAVPATPITIAINPVSLAGFSEANRSFVIAQATSDFVGFNTDAFAIDDSAFVTATGATGSWSIQKNGTNLELLYTAGPALTGYALWISGFEVEDQTALDDDFDQDKVPNGIEFLLGGNPSIPNDVALPVPTAGGNDLVLSFIRDDQSIGALTTVVQTSTDLVTWLPGDEIAIGEFSTAGVDITDNGTTDTVVVTIPKAAAPAKFARFRVSIP